MHPAWPDLHLAAKALVALHEAGHAVSAYHLGVRFSEVVIGEYAVRTSGFGYVVYSSVPPNTVESYYHNYVISTFAGKAAIKMAVDESDDAEVSSIYKLGNENDFEIATRIATEQLKLAEHELVEFLDVMETHANELMNKPETKIALKAVASALLEQGTLTYQEVGSILGGGPQSAEDRSNT